MKATFVVLALSGLFAGEAARSALRYESTAPAPASSPAMSPAAAPGPSGPSTALRSITVLFDIDNFNYYDMEKDVVFETPKPTGTTVVYRKSGNNVVEARKVVMDKDGGSRSTVDYERIEMGKTGKAPCDKPVVKVDLSKKGKEEKKEMKVALKPKEPKVEEAKAVKDDGLHPIWGNTGEAVGDVFSGVQAAKPLNHLKVDDVISGAVTKSVKYVIQEYIDGLAKSMQAPNAALTVGAPGAPAGTLLAPNAAPNAAALTVGIPAAPAPAAAAPPASAADGANYGPPGVSVYVAYQPGTERALDVNDKETLSYKLPSADAKDKKTTIMLNVKPLKTKYYDGPGTAAHADRVAQPVGRTTRVVATVTQLMLTGVDETDEVEAFLEESAEAGELEKLLERHIFVATGLRPTISNLTVTGGKIENWAVDTCSAHMSKVVSRFANAYTRRMVPTAIYNECTNFMPSMSFSHDLVPSALDRQKCRVASIKFTKLWNFGHHEPRVTPCPTAEKAAAGPAAAAAAPVKAKAPKDAMDFSSFCVDICEYKYGKAAPQCHVTSGKKLLNKPN